MTGPCAKTTIRCTLVTPAGEHIVGENWCANPQPACPRGPGEDYTKCRTICQQEGHAEYVAVGLAGPKARGAHAYFEGHTYACMACQHAMFGAGVVAFSIGKPPLSNPSPMTPKPDSQITPEPVVDPATSSGHARTTALLLPCPFCGAAPVIEEDREAAHIYCNSDDCLGPSISSHSEPWAVEQWNRRAISLQQRVEPWLMACFGEVIAGDKIERNHRFLEEALELVQACGCTASEAHQLVDYTYGRPVGEKFQEAGGVVITLAALCRAQGIDMHDAGEVELARIWTMVDKIRAKQAAKPKHSPLPEHRAMNGLAGANEPDKQGS